MEAEHVDNLDTIAKLQKQGFDGSDADLDISLFEYGLAWRDLGNGEWLFVYGIACAEVDGDIVYTRFDRVSQTESDFESDYTFADFDAVAKCHGIDAKVWLSMPYPLRIENLVAYYGSDDILGTPYWQGFAIAS